MNIKTKNMILAAIFSALMVIGAFLKIPFPFVPLTFQPFFCALSGILLGARLGALSQLIYLCIGLAGAPVFAYGGGITYIFNPTFGYLVGFVAASFVIGKMGEKLQNITFIKVFYILVTGLIVINLIGVPYFYLIKNLYLNEGVSALYVISVIFLPYFIKDLILYIAAAFSAARIIPVLRKEYIKG